MSLHGRPAYPGDLGPVILGSRVGVHRQRFHGVPGRGGGDEGSWSGNEPDDPIRRQRRCRFRDAALHKSRLRKPTEYIIEDATGEVVVGVATLLVGAAAVAMEWTPDEILHHDGNHSA